MLNDDGVKERTEWVMGPIQPVIQPVTIDTMLNNNGLNNGHGLKNVTM